MILAGVWNFPLYENNILQKGYEIYAFGMKCGYAFFYSSLVGETVRLIVCNYELSVIVGNVGVLFNATKIAIKILIYDRFDLFQLFEKIIEKEKEIWQSGNQEIITMYNGKIRVCSMYVLVLATSTFVAVCLLQTSGSYINQYKQTQLIRILGMFAIYKLIEYNQLHNDTLEPHFMYQSLFPLNKLDNIQLFFVSQVLFAWFGTTFNIMTHGVFVTLLVYSASQLEKLQICMRNFVGNVQTEILEPEEINERIVILKKLIQDHIHIIE